MHTLEHPNGLSVQFDSAAMTAIQTERGFEFAPADAAERRAPWSAELALESGSEPPGTWPSQRNLNGRSARFRVDVRPGGSGGNLFTLSAWVACAPAHLTLRLEAQGESQPDAEFEQGWALLSSAACRS